MAPVQALALALTLSVAGNVAVGRAWLSVRDDLATAIVQRDTARASPSCCCDCGPHADKAR